MTFIENNCECLEKLYTQGKVDFYCPPYNVLAPSAPQVEEGHLCLANDVVVDEGYYDEFAWVGNVSVYRELYPIDFCPICGKKIEYKKINYLTKKL